MADSRLEEFNKELGALQEKYNLRVVATLDVLSNAIVARVKAEDTTPATPLNTEETKAVEGSAQITEPEAKAPIDSA